MKKCILANAALRVESINIPVEKLKGKKNIKILHYLSKTDYIFLMNKS